MEMWQGWWCQRQSEGLRYFPLDESKCCDPLCTLCISTQICSLLRHVLASDNFGTCCCSSHAPSSEGQSCYRKRCRHKRNGYQCTTYRYTCRQGTGTPWESCAEILCFSEIDWLVWMVGWTAEVELAWQVVIQPHVQIPSAWKVDVCYPSLILEGCILQRSSARVQH